MPCINKGVKMEIEREFIVAEEHDVWTDENGKQHPSCSLVCGYWENDTFICSWFGSDIMTGEISKKDFEKNCKILFSKVLTIY